MLHYHPLNFYFEQFLNITDINSLYSLSTEYKLHFYPLISKLYKDIHITIYSFKNEPFYIKYNISGKGLYWYYNFLNKYNFIFDNKNKSYYKYLNILKYNNFLNKLKNIPVSYSFSKLK